MKLPDTQLVDNQTSAVTLSFAVPAGHEAFAGHFPGHPILPGVVQVDWAMRLAAQQLKLGNVYAHEVQIKFRDTITPDQPLELHLEYIAAKHQLRFTYSSGEQMKSTGKIRLEAA